jgi:hypothetical protein
MRPWSSWRSIAHPARIRARSYGILAEYQRPVAHALIDAGADFVVGHHPHVVHPIERHRNGLIAYSLGNYVFQSWGHFDRPATEVLPADATTEKPEPALPRHAARAIPQFLRRRGDARGTI